MTVSSASTGEGTGGPAIRAADRAISVGERATREIRRSSSRIRTSFELPEVPTLKEQGVDTFMESYAGLAAPAGTPPERLQKLEKVFSEAVNDPEVQETMKGLGMEPFYFTSAEYRTLLKNGHETMATELVKVGLKK